MNQGTSEIASAVIGHPGKRDILKMFRLATAKMFEHRKRHKWMCVRIGFWPDGMVIDARIPARTNAELEAMPDPIVINWDRLETIQEVELLALVDHVCEKALQAVSEPATLPAH